MANSDPNNAVHDDAQKGEDSIFSVLTASIFLNFFFTNISFITVHVSSLSNISLFSHEVSRPSVER